MNGLRTHLAIHPTPIYLLRKKKRKSRAAVVLVWVTVLAVYWLVMG